MSGPEDNCATRVNCRADVYRGVKFLIFFLCSIQNCMYNSQISLLTAAFPWKELRAVSYVWNCQGYIFGLWILGAWTSYLIRERLLCPWAEEHSGGIRGQDAAELKVSPWPNVGGLKGDGMAQKFYIKWIWIPFVGSRNRFVCLWSSLWGLINYTLKLTGRGK